MFRAGFELLSSLDIRHSDFSSRFGRGVSEAQVIFHLSQPGFNVKVLT